MLAFAVGVRAAVGHYVVFARMWSRAAWQYRTSLALLTVGQAAATGLDLAIIAIVFAHLPRLAGFSLAEVAFLYGTSSTSFGLADLLFGAMDRLGEHLRTGTLDVMLTRPVGLLVQVASDEFSPRRLGRLSQGVAVLAVSLTALDVHWTAARILLVPMIVTSGLVLFAAIWIAGAAFQFLVPQAHEAMNALTYGGTTMTQYPLSVFGRQGMRLLTFVVPMAFVNWQPALYVLNRPDPLGMPGAVRLLSPAVAAAMAALAALAWRAGVRRYRSTGS